MKSARLTAMALSITVVLSVLFAPSAFAKSDVLIDDDMNGVIQRDKIVENSGTGTITGDIYPNAKGWGSQWGISHNGNQYMWKDVDNGIQMDSIVADEEVSRFIQHRFLPAGKALSKGTELKIELDMKMLSKPETSNIELWVCMENYNTILFRCYVAPSGVTLGYCAAESEWPYTDTKPDSNTGMKMDFDGEYKLVITAKPRKDSDNYKVVFELYSSADNYSSPAAGAIVEEWSKLTPDRITELYDIHLVARQKSRNDRSEEIMCINGVKVTAITEEKRPEAVFSPKDGARTFLPNEPLIVTFDQEVEPVEAADVSISGDALVERVEMNEGNTEARIYFSNLTKSNKYDVTINGVSIAGGDERFDEYKTSFFVPSGRAFYPAYTSEQTLKTGSNTVEIGYTSGADSDSENAVVLAAFCKGTYDSYILSGAQLINLSEFAAEGGTAELAVNVPINTNFVKFFVMNSPTDMQLLSDESAIDVR